VHDSIDGFKANPIGKISLGLAGQSYALVAKPLLPYLARPYEYVSPYLRKADSLADDGLRRVDAAFPAVKTPTAEIRGSIVDTVLLPVRVAAESKEYVFRTWDNQYRDIRKGEGEGAGASTGAAGAGASLLRVGRAAVSTGLTVTADSLAWLNSFLRAKGQQTKQAVQEKSSQASGNRAGSL
jgi:hypothetical protein